MQGLTKDILSKVTVLVSHFAMYTLVQNDTCGVS